MTWGVELRTGSWCIHCFKTPEESAGQQCKNPSWHYSDVYADERARQRERQERGE